MRDLKFYLAAIAAYAVLLLITGCASGNLTLRPDPEQPAVLEIDPNVVGRGCLYASYEDGKLEVMVIQDGTSDWSVTRAVSWIADVAAEVFGAGESGSGMQGPDPIHACTYFFEEEEGEPEDPA